MAGDYNKLRMAYADRSVDAVVLTTTDYTTANTLITVRSAEHQIFIQKIHVSVNVYAAKTWTFQDDSGTPVLNGVLSIPAAAPTTAGDVEFVIDFGPVGYGLTKGQSFQLKMSATGAAAAVHIEGYEKLAPGAYAMAAVGGKTN